MISTNFKFLPHLITLLFLMFSVHSCKSDLSDEVASSKDDKIIKLIEKAGLDLADFEILEDGVIMEGDMVFTREQFIEWLSREESIDSETIDFRQRTVVSTSAIDYSRIGDIKIGIDWSMYDFTVGGVDAFEAVLDAMAKWNNIPNCKLKLRQTGPTIADIVVFADNAFVYGVLSKAPSNYFNISACMYSNIPFFGNKAYPFLSINDDQGHNNYALFVENIVHALGHNLGIVHTNGVLWSGVYFSCSPGTDNGSIMNGPNCSAFNPLPSSPNVNDKRMLQFMWPSSLTAPTITSASLNWDRTILTINTNNPDNTYPYHTDFEIVDIAGNVTVTGTLDCYDSNKGWNWDGNGTLTTPVPIVLGLKPSVRVRFKNYKGDLVSNWSQLDFI